TQPIRHRRTAPQAPRNRIRANADNRKASGPFLFERLWQPPLINIYRKPVSGVFRHNAFWFRGLWRKPGQHFAVRGENPAGFNERRAVRHRRREFITLLGGAAAVWPLAARAADGIPQPLSAPADATMNSEAWNFLYSPNMPAHPTARDATGWEFKFRPRDGVQYLVQPVIGRLGSRISATFVVERDGRLVESDPCDGSQAAVRLFFQRRGDDLTAAKEFHRWWSMETFL